VIPAADRGQDGKSALTTGFARALPAAAGIMLLALLSTLGPRLIADLTALVCIR
jgi:hypothetical protein